jgi:hypothetical protein
MNRIRKSLTVALASLTLVALTACGGTSAKCKSAPEITSAPTASVASYRPVVIPPRPIIPVRPSIPAPRPVTPSKPSAPSAPSRPSTGTGTTPYHPVFPYWLPFVGHGSTDCK